LYVTPQALIGQVIQKFISQERKGIRAFWEDRLAACGYDLYDPPFY